MSLWKAGAEIPRAHAVRECVHMQIERVERIHVVYLSTSSLRSHRGDAEVPIFRLNTQTLFTRAIYFALAFKGQSGQQHSPSSNRFMLIIRRALTGQRSARARG